MKVGLVVPGGVARDPADGRIPCLQSLIDRLARRHDVHVFSLHWVLEQAVRRHNGQALPSRSASAPDRYPFFGATVHEGGARHGRLRVLAGILGEHHRAPFDVLHALWVSPPGVIAAWARKLLQRPVVLHVAGGELVAIPDIGYGGLITRRGRLWARMGLSGASVITAASAPLVEIIRARGRPAERLALGVDLQRWPPRPPHTRRPGATARLVHVADLNPVKDQFTLLEAARLLAGSGVTFQLDIAGRDTLGGALQAHARRLGIGDRVRFLGRIPHEQLHALIAESDIFWLSSRHEAGPVAVLEAAIVGVPTVGTAVGHVAEWAPSAAVAVPIRDPEALARETADLLNNEGRRVTLAWEAQRRAIAQDADWTAQQVEARYERLVTEAMRTDRDR